MSTNIQREVDSQFVLFARFWLVRYFLFPCLLVEEPREALSGLAPLLWGKSCADFIWECSVRLVWVSESRLEASFRELVLAAPGNFTDMDPFLRCGEPVYESLKIVCFVLGRAAEDSDEELKLPVLLMDDGVCR